MEKPLVSFIMGVYNTRNLNDLKRSIDNMLNQTYPNIQVVICDDGSTNHVFGFIQEHFGADNRVKAIRREENKGFAFTANECLQLADGIYIARQDDDDYSAADRIDKQVAFLEMHPEYALVSAGLSKYDRNGIWSSIQLKESPQKRDFRFHSQHVHAATLFRAETLRCVNGYRVSKETMRAEDYDLFMRIYAAGMKGYNLQEILYYYNYPRGNVRRIKYYYKIREATVRRKGFCAMKLPIIDYVYILKPLIAGLISEGAKQKIKMMLCEKN